jgi:NitT/TauT family transport system substrate-binding protein
MTDSPNPSKLLKVFLLSVALFSWGCQSDSGQAPESPPIKLSLAVQPTLFSGLIAIADEKGYFKKEGLEVLMDLHPSGRSSLEAVCFGKAQVATVSDFAFTAKALEEPSIRVLASIGTTVGSQIVARKDRNIQEPSDLRGKRVAFTAGTTNDYFLYVFLLTRNIPQKDITFVDIPADRQVEALVNGDVDAISAFETYAFEAEKLLEDNAISWESQNDLAYHWLLVVRENLIQSPEPLKRLFKALIKAEDFARANEDETKRIIAQKWGFDPSFVQQYWTGTRLSVSFGQSVVISLQNYTRWQINKAGKSTEPPDVLNFMHPGILKEVDPSLVTIYM